jgi:hypothetical protein
MSAIVKYRIALAATLRALFLFSFASVAGVT